MKTQEFLSFVLLNLLGFSRLLSLLLINLCDLILIDPIHNHTDNDNQQKINLSEFESFAEKTRFLFFSHPLSLEFCRLKALKPTNCLYIAQFFCPLHSPLAHFKHNHLENHFFAFTHCKLGSICSS